MSDEEQTETTIIVPPTWQFNPWNVVGIVLTTLGGHAQVAGQGLNLLAQECWAHARWAKEQRELEEAWLAEEAERQEMAEAYERLVGLDEHWIDPEEPTT